MRLAAKVLGTALLGVAMLVGASFRQQGAAAPQKPGEPLKAFLRSYLNPGRGSFDETTRIAAVSVKAKGEASEEEIVYVSGQSWCGSGGCTMLILEPAESSFKVLGRVTIVQLPVRLLSSMENGHPDIGVRVRGGGIQPGYEAVLSFDGTTYPTNPSLPPARRVTGIEGKEIIAKTETGVPLYE
jgi:hypothetical protein